jgi:hypothetical protein
MNYHVGKRLLWVPYHNDGYEKQRAVEVAELRADGCAKLDNGWIVNEIGEAVTADRTRTGAVIEAVFEPPGYVDDCL